MYEFHFLPFIIFLTIVKVLMYNVSYVICLTDGSISMAQHVVRAGACVGGTAGRHRAPTAAVARPRVVPSGEEATRLVCNLTSCF